MTVNLTTISNLIDRNSSSVFISYIDLNGFPVTKAMLAPRKQEGLKHFYFTTNTSSNKTASYLLNERGSIYFVDKRFFRGVSLVGTVEVLNDEKVKMDIWRKGDEKYYKEGVNDPDYCVLKFTITHGRVYSSYSNKDFIIE